MSVWQNVKAKAEELLGRAEQVYGESHGDTAATAAGEAHRLEAEGTTGEPGQHRRPDDDGLAGQGAVT
jgi:uncharacterized protein YjbJ (UPF0337 family)